MFRKNCFCLSSGGRARDSGLRIAIDGSWRVLRQRSHSFDVELLGWKHLALPPLFTEEEANRMLLRIAGKLTGKELAGRFATVLSAVDIVGLVETVQEHATERTHTHTMELVSFIASRSSAQAHVAGSLPGVAYATRRATRLCTSDMRP